jgi:catechol 2,3-dioxygenase-like lactoylglutathione lyase family enzyme
MSVLAKTACAVALAIPLVTAGAAAAQQQRPAPGQPPATSTTAVRRTTLLVEDLARAVDFYQRLGLVKWYDKASTASDPGGVLGAGDLPLTADPTVGRLIIMKGTDERIGMIGLLAYDKPKLASARGNLAGLGTGDIVIMMEVPDIQEIYRRLSQIGTRFHRTPTRFAVTAADGSQTTGQRMFAFDPDGHLIEIVQHDKK